MDMNRFVTDADRCGRSGYRSHRAPVGPVTAPVIALFVAGAIALGGCQSAEHRETPPPASPPMPEAPAIPQPAPVPEASLSTAIDYLESGKADRARTMLAELAAKAPGSTVLASLLRQIEAPIEQLLPGPYRRIEVGPGESLSLIAARELGDPLAFYALARLNNIEVPARVPVGTVLRVPDRSGTASATSAVPDEPTDISPSEIESVAEYLDRSGQGDQARRMLIGRMQRGDAPESTRVLLIELTRERAADLGAAGEFERAISVIDQTLPVIEAPQLRTSLIELRSTTRSDMLLRSAAGLRDQGELIAAYEMAVQAAELDKSSSRADALVGEMRTTLVASLHNDALLAWRDRNVDLAIRTWESLLEAVPDFEPARVYLERARRLRERLDQP